MYSNNMSLSCAGALFTVYFQFPQDSGSTWSQLNLKATCAFLYRS